MLAVGKDLALQGEERAAGIDQIETGEVVCQGDLLRAQVLLDRDREIGAALDGGVVGHDDDFMPADAADAGHDAGRWSLILIHAFGGQWREFEEGAGRIDHAVNALMHRQLAATALPLVLSWSATRACSRQALLQLLDHVEIGRAVGLEL